MIYTFEINSKDYATNGFYTLSVQERFPQLINKRVIVSPNWWRLDNAVVPFDGANNAGTATEGYVVKSNLYNLNSLTSSSKSSDILFPLSTSTKSYYDYQFESIMPAVVRVYLTKFDSSGETSPFVINSNERLMISFNVIEN